MGTRIRLGLAAIVVAALVVPVLAACAPSGDPAAGRVTGPPGTAPAVAPGTTGTVDLDGRPYELHVPAGYDPAEPVPLVVGLHRYASSAAELDSYLGLTTAADERGFLLALPEGTQGRGRMRFWNATPVCCNFERADVDDSGYLSRLVEQVAAAYPVSRAVVVGHSNGGYMAHRLACEHADQFSAIASLAGLIDGDPTRCLPAHPVSVVQIHGTADADVPYEGTRRGVDIAPSAPQTTASWARLDGCSDPPDDRARTLDLVEDIPGAETAVTAYPCPDGVRVELWTVEGGEHIPALTPAFTPAVLDLLLG